MTDTLNISIKLDLKSLASSPISAVQNCILKSDMFDIDSTGSRDSAFEIF